MAPVQGVHKEAVGQYAAPCGNQDRRGDAPGVPPGDSVPQREQERAEHDPGQHHEPGCPFLGERTDIGAVSRDGLVQLELTRADTDRVALAEPDSAGLRSEPLCVIRLEARALFQERELPRRLDRHGDRRRGNERDAHEDDRPLIRRRAAGPRRSP